MPQLAATSILAGASHFQMGDLQYINAPNAHHITLQAAGNDTATPGGMYALTSPSKGSITKNVLDPMIMCTGWQLLQQHAALQALHDSDARFDPPKCDEDTRVEVNDEIMAWIEDRQSPQRLLCMTGAAGAGKSAIQQQSLSDVLEEIYWLPHSFVLLETQPETPFPQSSQRLHFK
jgi:hypothetical protein